MTVKLKILRTFASHKARRTFPWLLRTHNGQTTVVLREQRNLGGASLPGGLPRPPWRAPPLTTALSSFPGALPF